MPEIEIATNERQKIERVIDLIKRDWNDLTPEGRQVFTIAFMRVFGSDFKRIIEQLKPPAK